MSQPLRGVFFTQPVEEVGGRQASQAVAHQRTPRAGAHRVLQGHAYQACGDRVALLRRRGNAVVALDRPAVLVEHAAHRVSVERVVSGPGLVAIYEGLAAIEHKAVAVGLKAQAQGVARLKLTRQELYDRADYMIKRSRNLTQSMMKDGYIKEYKG